MADSDEAMKTREMRVVTASGPRPLGPVQDMAHGGNLLPADEEVHEHEVPPAGYGGSE